MIDWLGVCLISWVIRRLIDWLFGWLLDCLISLLIGCLGASLIAWLMCSLAVCMIDWLIDCLWLDCWIHRLLFLCWECVIVWLTENSIIQLIARLFDLSIDWSIAWSIGEMLVCLFGLWSDGLIVSAIESLVDCRVVDCLLKWLIAWPNDAFLCDWMIKFLLGWLVDCLFDLLISCFVD